MNQKEKKDCQYIMAYNIRVILKLWKTLKGSYGENRIRGCENDTDSLYASLEKSRQTIREIKYMEQSDYDSEKTKKWAKHIEQKTGIPCEYLEGKERIMLSSCYERDTYPKYGEYEKRCSEANDLFDNLDIRLSDPKMKKLLKKLKEEMKKGLDDKKKTDMQDIGNVSKRRIKENTKEMIKKIEHILEAIDAFEKGIEEEMSRLKKADSIDYANKDRKLYKLLYFIRYGEKLGGAGVKTIGDMMEVMKETRTRQLMKLGQKKLGAYIEALREQLKLAESVYTVAVDCGDFKD